MNHRWLTLAVIAACKNDASPPSPAPAPAPPSPAAAVAPPPAVAVAPPPAAAVAPPPAPTDAPTATPVGALPAEVVAPKPLEVVPWDGKPLPAGVAARGATIERVVMFVDGNGTNYVAFSSTETHKPNGGAVASRMLFVDHWAVPATGKARALLPARDQISECEMGDVLAQFVAGAFGVTDLDHDGLAELTYGYQLACRSDVSPATFKLLLAENGVKYILRGHTRIAGGDVPGGEFDAEPASSKWPAGFYDRARQLWNASADDLEIAPHR